jgi:hypothetical protein
MKLPKSPRIQALLSFVGIILALVLFYGPIALAAHSAKQTKAQATRMNRQIEGANATEELTFYPTVNLPFGEKFLAIGPNIGRSGHGTYITEKRPQGESPRRLTFYGPGGSPQSWEVVLLIQEH